MNINNALLAGTVTMIPIGLLFIAPLASADSASLYASSNTQYQIPQYRNYPGKGTDNSYNGMKNTVPYMCNISSNIDRNFFS